jgi:hypothetical protein
MPYFEPPMTDVHHKIICKKSNWKNNNICIDICQNCGNFENHWVTIANAQHKIYFATVEIMEN